MTRLASWVCEDTKRSGVVVPEERGRYDVRKGSKYCEEAALRCRTETCAARSLVIVTLQADGVKFKMGRSRWNVPQKDSVLPGITQATQNHIQPVQLGLPVSLCQLVGVERYAPEGTAEPAAIVPTKAPRLPRIAYQAVAAY